MKSKRSTFNNNILKEVQKIYPGLPEVRYAEEYIMRDRISMLRW